MTLPWRHTNQSRYQAMTLVIGGLSGHRECTSFYTSRRCTSPGCVKLKNVNDRVWLAIIFFVCRWKLPQTLTDPNAPIKTLRQKKTTRTKTTRKNIKKQHQKNNKTKQNKTKTHTHTMNTKKHHAKTHRKSFAMILKYLIASGETWEPPPLSKRASRSQPYGGGPGRKKTHAKP